MVPVRPQAEAILLSGEKIASVSTGPAVLPLAGPACLTLMRQLPEGPNERGGW
jgi:hypothetical protein